MSHFVTKCLKMSHFVFQHICLALNQGLQCVKELRCSLALLD